MLVPKAPVEPIQISQQLIGIGRVAAHRHVWPEMLDLLKRPGVSKYSIFRRDEQLLLFMEVADLNATWDQLDADPVNQRWQIAMNEFFEPSELRPGERLRMMEEVFHCP